MSPFKPCPSCPDGNVWVSNGPTAKACPTCNGKAIVNLDGSPVSDAEEEDAYVAELEQEEQSLDYFNKYVAGDR